MSSLQEIFTQAQKEGIDSLGDTELARLISVTRSAQVPFQRTAGDPIELAVRKALTEYDLPAEDARNSASEFLALEILKLKRLGIPIKEVLEEAKSHPQISIGRFIDGCALAAYVTHYREEIEKEISDIETTVSRGLWRQRHPASQDIDKAKGRLAVKEGLWKKAATSPFCHIRDELRLKEFFESTTAFQLLVSSTILDVTPLELKEGVMYLSLLIAKER